MIKQIEIKEYGICNVSIAPVRASNSDEAEILTQLLFGNHVKIIKKGQPWIKIKFEADNYIGWMDFKQLTYIEEEEYTEIDQNAIVYLKDPLMELDSQKGKQTIMLGSALPHLDGNKIHFGGEEYLLANLPNQEDITVIKTAMLYLNTPYLWGGKSLFGIDCSGIVQNVFGVHSIALPRNASQQVMIGEDIAFENRQIGDVPFFINAKGIVHHVGILTEKDKIIHAAGCVRIDSFDVKGIFRNDMNKYTHHYHSIKRYS